MTVPDALLRSACDVALRVAKADQVAVPPRPVPSQLRRLLGFARPSASALAVVRRVLDEDEDFRSHVCDVVGPEVLAAPGSEAAALFLRRPQGWQEALEELASAAADEASAAEAERADAANARRLAAAETARARSDDLVASLRQEVATLRARATAEARARRTAESDVGRLRKRVAELEQAATAPGPSTVPGDAAGGSPAPAAALAAAEERALRAEAVAARAEEEAAMARADLAAAQAATGASAPGGDREAVREAVSAAVESVRCLAEALARAAEALAPAGGPSWPPPGDAPGATGPPPRRGGEQPSTRRDRLPEPLPPAILEEDPEAAEHLLRVPRVLVLVDGYNVTKKARGGSPLPDQRRWLLDAAAEAVARTGAEFSVVFDGVADGGAPPDGPRRFGVQVRFTAAGVEADDELLELLAALPTGRPAVVVSDDHRVRSGARLLGANVVGVDQLVAALRR